MVYGYGRVVSDLFGARWPSAVRHIVSLYLTHSVIELLQVQSQRLANMESELSSARRALNERKIIERAKGILMARFNLAEDEAYKKMRTTAMQQNRRLVEVAEAALSLDSLT